MSTITYKSLGQSNPAATTETTLYTVPAATAAVCSTITACNTSATPCTYRVYLRVAGAAATTKQYLVYDATLNGNNTVTLTLGITMAATDVMSVYCSTNTAAFNLSGSEIS